MVVAPRAPIDPTNGVDLIALNVFPLVARTWSLTLVAYQSTDIENYHRTQLSAMFEEVHLVKNSGRLPELLGWLAADLSRLPLRRMGSIDLLAARDFRRSLASALNARHHDIIHVRNLAMAPFARPYRSHARLIELVDSPLLAEERLRSRRFKGRLRRAAATLMEKEALKTFDVSTTASSADAAGLRRHNVGARIEAVPNGVDTKFFAPLSRRDDDPETIVFLGAMEYGPNVDAVRWLVDQILPILRERHAGVRLTIVGRSPADALRTFAESHDVELTGTVPDVRPYLAQATVFVAPMVTGTGIKNKVLEAMSMGLPIVATTIAVEALEVEPGVHCLVADGAEEFTTAVERLLGDADLRRQLGANARRLVEQRYSWDATARRYEQIYESLMATANRASDK